MRTSQACDGTKVQYANDLSPKNLSAMMGGQNCHAEVLFADGEVWLARFRPSGPISPPPAVPDYMHAAGRGCDNGVSAAPHARPLSARVRLGLRVRSGEYSRTLATS